MSENEQLASHVAGSQQPQLELMQCKYCLEEIKTAAKVCKNCGRHQHTFWQHFRIEQVGLLISFLMMLIGYTQLSEARSERILATDALKRAQSAEENIITLNSALREQFLLVASLTWLQIETKNEFGTDRTKVAIDEMLKDLNIFFPQVMPDPMQRKQWIENLQKRLPPRE